MFRYLAGALAALALTASSAYADGGAPDAEIFATNNTAVITDPADPRLDDPLTGFARRVERIVARGGGTPVESELLDGVFFSSDQGTTTFERSRRFDVDKVAKDELHTIADTVRSRFGQQSVLTFDRLPREDAEVDAIELEVPSVTAQDLRDGLLADQDARERLFGGSVTLDKRLILIAALEDAEFARRFARRIGGEVRHADTAYGEREFVEGPSPVRAARRTLLIEGGADDDVIGIAPRAGRLEVDLGDDGSADFVIARRRFDRVRIDAAAGNDTLVVHGVSAAERYDVRAAGEGVRLRRDLGDLRLKIDNVEILRTDARGGADRIEVSDLSATDTFQFDADVGEGDGARDRVLVGGSEGDEQISVSRFTSAVSVLGPTFVQIPGAEATDRLTVEGRAGDDIVSASTDAMTLTLDGGDGSDVLLGGPGPQTLIGGPDFDDVKGGPPRRGFRPFQLGTRRRQRQRRRRREPRFALLRGVCRPGGLCPERRGRRTAPDP
jgi:Ca2+-binding RTX toxin-like protein